MYTKEKKRRNLTSSILRGEWGREEDRQIDDIDDEEDLLATIKLLNFNLAAIFECPLILLIRDVCAARYGESFTSDVENVISGRLFFPRVGWRGPGWAVYMFCHVENVI